MTDRFRTAFGCGAVKTNVLLRGEPLLRCRESFSSFQQTHLTMFRRHYAPDERQVISKRNDRFRSGNTRVSAERLFEQRLCHRRDVLVRKAHVGKRKQRVTRLHRCNTDLPGGDERMPRDDLRDDRHRAWSSLERRGRDLSGESCFVVVEQTTVRNDVLRDRIETLREL